MAKIEKPSVVKSAAPIKKVAATEVLHISTKTLLTIILPIALVLLMAAGVMIGYLIGTAEALTQASVQPTPEKVVVMLTPSAEPTSSTVLSPSPTASLIPTPTKKPQEDNSNTVTYKAGRLGRTADAGEAYYESLYYVGGVEMVNLALYTGIPDDHVFAKDDGFTQVGALEDKRFRVEGYSAFFTVPEAMGKIEPKAIVMCFGYNGAPYMSVETYIFHYEKLVDAILKASPKTEIIIQMINPITYAAEQVELTKERDEGVGYYTNAKINEINSALQDLAGKKDQHYISSDGVLRINSDPESPLDPELAQSDGQLLNRAGCEKVASYIREHKLK